MKTIRLLSPLAFLLTLFAAAGCSDSNSTPTTLDELAVRVTPGDVGVEWLENDTRTGGTVAIQPMGGVPPLFGEGCLEFTTTDANGGSGEAKAQLYFYGYGSMDEPDAGVLLADLTSLGYWAYRASTSTNPDTQTVSINIEVDFVGDGTSYTTLVFEPIYDSQPMLLDTWQYWDACQGGAAIWWSSRDLPGVPAFTYVPLQTIIDNNPNAKIRYGLGLNVGSGWAGDFYGLADGLEVGVLGDRTVFDFEPQ